jgi:hypothetical protein
MDAVSLDAQEPSAALSEGVDAFPHEVGAGAFSE